MKAASALYMGALVAQLALAQQVQQDPLVSGPPLEPVFYYYNEWPTGITVSSTGRMFSCYPLGLDPMNTKYQVAELTGNSTETPYPSVEMNTPPGGAVNNSVYPPQGANYADYFISVQSVVVDAKDRLWVLDTGRIATSNGTTLFSSYGGPKLVGIDLSTNKVFQTLVFPANAVFGDSYPNDVRFDLRPSITASGQGVAYLTDSSAEGHNGLIICDLGTSECWRHLNNIPQVHPEAGFMVQVWGQTTYMNPGQGVPISRVGFGVDGITLSNDGETLYFSPVASRQLYAVPTSRLLDQSASSELFATASVMDLGQKGVSDGFESDSNGIVYFGSVETNSVNIFNPENGTVTAYVRDPRIDWTDTLSTSGNSLYFTENQLFRSPTYNGGVDKRVKPFVLYKVPLLNNGSTISLM